MHPLVHNVLGRLHWLVQYHGKRISFYWLPSHVGIRGNEKVEAAAKADILRGVTNIPIPYSDLKNTIMTFKNPNGSMSLMEQLITHYMAFILGKVCGLEVLELSLGMRRVF